MGLLADAYSYAFTGRDLSEHKLELAQHCDKINIGTKPKMYTQELLNSDGVCWVDVDKVRTGHIQTVRQDRNKRTNGMWGEGAFGFILIKGDNVAEICALSQTDSIIDRWKGMNVGWVELTLLRKSHWPLAGERFPTIPRSFDHIILCHLMSCQNPSKASLSWLFDIDISKR